MSQTQEDINNCEFGRVDSLHPSQQFLSHVMMLEQVFKLFLVCTSTKQRIKCLAKGHNACETQTPTPRYWVKHSTTESHCTPDNFVSLNVLTLYSMHSKPVIHCSQ